MFPEASAEREEYEKQKAEKLRRIGPFRHSKACEPVPGFDARGDKAEEPKPNFSKPFVLRGVAAVLDARRDPACRLNDSMQKWAAAFPKSPDAGATGRAFALCEDQQGGADALDLFKPLVADDVPSSIPRLKAATRTSTFFGQVPTYVGCEWTFEFLANSILQWSGTSTWILMSGHDALRAVEQQGWSLKEPSLKTLLESLDAATTARFKKSLYTVVLQSNDLLHVPAGWLCMSMSGTLGDDGVCADDAEAVVGLQLAHLPKSGLKDAQQNYVAIHSLRPGDDWPASLLDLCSVSTAAAASSAAAKS